MARGPSTNSEGSLVDTIYYESPGVSLTDKAAEALAEDEEGAKELKVGQVKIPVEVRLRKAFKDSGGTNRVVEQLDFALVCKKPRVVVRGSDIEALRRAMWAELDKDSAITWAEHLLVTIEPSRSYGRGIGEGLLLNEETVWKGVTKDGYELLKEFRHDRLSHDWAYRPWPGAFTDKAGRVTACIPATKANRDAMDEFRVRIRELRARLQDLVRPQSIMATLANLSGIALLAAPDDEGSEAPGNG